jgi:hypothetical protein
MTLNNFEESLKEINQDIHITPHPNNSTMAGVYYLNNYICACPNGEVFEDVRPNYQSDIGHRHATLEEITAKVKSFLHRWENEEGFKDLYKD